MSLPLAFLHLHYKITVVKHLRLGKGHRNNLLGLKPGNILEIVNLGSRVRPFVKFWLEH